MFEFTTTACERPELIEPTYRSLNRVITDLDTKAKGRLYLNIDPVPHGSERVQKEVVVVAEDYFAEVCVRIGPEGGDFAKAADWCFRQPDGEFFFHCEDDWRFWGELSVERYKDKIRKMENGLQCVTKDNGGGNRIHLPPSMFRTSIIQSVLDRFPIPSGENPELFLIDVMEDLEYNVTGCPDTRREDLGREWMDERDVSKDKDSGGPGDFIGWEC